MKIINVLSPYYFQDCHIPGSMSIPLQSLAEQAERLDKNEEIIIYCAHVGCPASKEAWHILKDHGFTKIYAYEGGIAEWYQRGFPIAGPAKEHYLKEKHEAGEADPEVVTITAEKLLEKLPHNL